ncbi:MAG TPA: hypothetical protein VK524_15610 [Polyangiaceae bacterium]|nr:hypothetical protein [Polyangiaceae bacterium]
MQRLFTAWWALGAALALITGCYAEPDEDVRGRPDSGAPHDPGDAGPDAQVSKIQCDTARSGGPLPARSAVMSSSAQVGSRLVFTRDLFDMFASYCGACHVSGTRPGAFGGERITFANFSSKLTESVVSRIRTDDPREMMPPPEVGGLAFSQRSEDDPVRELVALIEAWIAAGKPAESFERESSAGGNDGRPYLFPSSLGESLTNIGNCVPEALKSETQRVTDLDQLFAAVQSVDDLPSQLEDTDLFTFDSAELAQHGIVAFAPAYPLWSDDAGKLRHVRVPRGQSIRYDAATREFQIPPNTRFYKTFLKKVIDASGRESYRKIETRLIVSRPDDCSRQPCEMRAITAAYEWDRDDEAKGARLVTQPLRDGTPFTDRVFTYVTDEMKEAELRRDGRSPSADEFAQITRHYAIPGSQRCRECHMGSSSKSGVLGFTPLQIRRWPYVAEPDPFVPGIQLQGYGILEEHAPGPDELTQLSRFIEYGLVTGLSSQDDVVSLRDSQDELPRNGFELIAQGYMLGNCAHCHNPRGFPSIENPELAPVLDFYPDRDGGIFGFPLERTSPRIRRGLLQNVEIPYITPSLFDHRYTAGASGIPKKHYAALEPPTRRAVPAPWRSFIYRNVDSPFTYSEDYAIFPHMPRSTAGFDCNAPRVLADWMVSLPAKLKPDVATVPAEIAEAQPYVGVSRESLDYAAAVSAARVRHRAYREGSRHGYCPDTSDIQDPDVLAGIRDVPDDALGQELPGWVSGLPRFKDGVPDRSHWVVSDMTDLPPPWVPRRSDWEAVLLGDPSSVPGIDADERRVLEILKADNVRITPEFRQFALKEVPYGFWEKKPRCSAILEQRPTLLSLLETGNPPQWSGSPPPDWLVRVTRAGSSATRNDLTRAELREPAYASSPGAAVFNAVCRNCHGVEADGDSLNATTIENITGGKTRVANLRDGILGPPQNPGSNREQVFGNKAAGLSADDVAGRYLVWMALGGTEASIPPAVVNSIGQGSVLGEHRDMPDATLTPNMLEVARLLCRASVGQWQNFDALYGPTYLLEGGRAKDTPLIPTNGDQAMWQRLCSAGRRPPIRALEAKPDEDAFGSDDFLVAEFPRNQSGDLIDHIPELLDPDAYGDGLVITLSETSYALSATPQDGDKPGVRRPVIKPARALDSLREPIAWCIRKPEFADYELVGNAEERYAHDLSLVEKFVTDNAIDGQPLPFCVVPAESPRWTDEQLRRWALRGAMNAGLAVFLYLDQVARRQIQPTLQWNECDKLLPVP